MDKVKSSNTFNGGLNRDNLNSLSDNRSYRYARNAVNSNSESRGFGLTNEESNKLSSGIENVVGAFHLAASNETLFLVEGSEFYLVNHDTGEKTTIFKASEFDCDFQLGDCEWHDVEVRYEDDDCNDRFVYFSSKCEYYWFNMDEMLDADRKQGLKDSLECEGCLKGCDYFKVFQCVCSPKISVKGTSNKDVGSLRAGAYWFVARLVNRDGGWTNWFNLSDKVNIGSQHNVAGEPVGGSIQVSLSCLDCKYSRVELAVISRIGGSYAAKTLGILNYSSESFSYNYYGIEGDDIDVAELLVPDTTYPKGKSLEQKDGTMLYYNIKQEANINFQKVANDIEVEWVEYELPYEYVKQHDIKSFMRGETYAFAIQPNRCDDRPTHMFHIPAKGENSGGETNGLDDVVLPGSETTGFAASSEVVEVTSHQEVVRTQSGKPDSVSEPQLDEYIVETEALVDSFTTEVSDICDCLDCGDDHCNDDIGKVDSIVKKWGAILASMGQDETASVLTPANIKEAATAIMTAIKNRERISRVAEKFNVNRPDGHNDYGGTTTVLSLTDDPDNDPDLPTEESPFGKESTKADNYHDCCGIPNKGIWFKELDSGTPTIKEEESIFYSCAVDCNGEPFFGDLAGEKVRHHTFPTADVKVPFRSMSVGVPSKYVPDADEYADGFVRILGVRFKNINIPENIMEDLCNDSPYTIGMIKRDDSNKSILFKGVAFDTFVVINEGKEYEQQRHAANSHVEVSRYANHDKYADYPRLMNEGSGESNVVYSLDALTRYPALNADRLRKELKFKTYVGACHGMYAKGRDPVDKIKGQRVDQRGTRQSLNMATVVPNTGESSIDFKIYAPADSVVAPPLGNSNRPLMNKSQQACVWVQAATLEHNTDHSFTGQVLNQTQLINYAETDYVSFIRSMDNQYGQLESASYMPIMTAGKNNANEIEGAVGDIYIGPWSFVKTSYVSDRVGSCEEDKKFVISNEVPWKKNRCICDGPDDVVTQQNGFWTWNKLPQNGDKADPKNWAGCQTVNNSELRTVSESRANPASSDYYYPKTLTTNFTVWGESEVCPWLRQKSDTLPQQFYPEINPEYAFDSGWDIDSSTPWEDAYLNQFYYENTQPSLWQKGLKALIRTAINTIMVIWGVDNMFDISSNPDILGNLIEFPLIFAIWMLLTTVLASDEKIDEILGIPPCKSDDQGGEGDGFIKKFFTNFMEFNWDYSSQNELEVAFGMPEQYNTCECEDCVNGETTNEIFYSDPQMAGSDLDGYKHVRPRNKIDIKGAQGKLTNIFSVGSALYAHTTDTIWQVRYGLTSLPSSIGEIRLGTGDYLKTPVSIAEGVPEGVAGLQYKNAAINTHYGYFFVDSDANKIYKFNGKLEEISAKGMFNFFKNNLKFCNPTECVDQRVEGTNYYALGVDPRYNRLLVTKSDGDASFTLSYDLAEQKWISFHDYTPKTYIWDRNNMMSLDETGVWKHNEKGTYQTFYGKFYPHEVEFVAMPQDIDTYTYVSTTLNTEAERLDGESWVEDLDVTFNKIAVYNSTQGTGTLNIQWVGDNKGTNENMYDDIVEKASIVKAHKKKRIWSLNGFKDYRKNDCAEQPMILQTECNPVGEINEDIFDCSPPNKQNYMGKVISDKYLTYRLKFDYTDDVNLNTIYVKTIGDDQTI